MEKFKHICIVRLSALGDVTHVLPVVSAIKDACPECKISWVIGAFEKKLISGLADVEFIPFNKSRGLSEYFRLYSLLKNRSFDVLLHMQLSLRANIIAKMVKAPIKIGYDSQRSKEGHSLVVNQHIRYVANQHMLEALLSFLEPLGIDKKIINYDMPISASAIDASKKLVSSERYIVISPASSHERRNWTASGYAAVADHLIREYGFDVVLCGGKSDSEKKLGFEIEKKMQCQATNVIGQDTLEQMVIILKNAFFLISPDSGPAHIANAVGTPVLGLYAATDPQRSGPYHSRQWCIDAYDKAAQEFLGKDASQLTWGKKIEMSGVMSLITTDEVIDRADQLLASLED